ncbi:hypothetical protein [Idiomarina baltica]|uniref:Uncharacterized conserved membrane protein, smp family protein n=1 Tax=Idiomarina baltica OS145 TaxID=314276 RepID=A0ABM9WKJ0_9GAMM|nr:hypothetical protein [Idiomarina baltica]EAQ31442.1 Uncharacterized conserved membrane protein, smp family protein [Idiomarina baltica OS145]
MKQNALPKYTLNELINRVSTAKLQRLTRVAFKRLLRFMAAAALLTLMYSIWNIATNQAQQQLEQNTREHLNWVLSQTAAGSQVFLTNGNQEGLQQLIIRLNEQPGVLAVTLRDAAGINQFSVGQTSSIIDYPSTLPEPWVLVHPIGDEFDDQGYLQVTFDKNQILDANEKTLLGLTSQGKTLLLLALITGGLIVLGFNRIRDRRWVKKQKQKHFS